MAAVPLSLQELSKLRLGRETLERWIAEPELEEIIRGCYVRILVGEKRGQRVYRICVVKGIETKDANGPLAAYKFGEAETDKHLQLEYGNVTKTFKMDYVSNADFTTEEFTEWLTQMQRTSQPILTGKDVERKVKRIKAFVLEKRAREAAEKERPSAAPTAAPPTVPPPAESSANSAAPAPTPAAVSAPAAAPPPAAEMVEDDVVDLEIEPPVKRPKLTQFRLEKPDLRAPEEVDPPLAGPAAPQPNDDAPAEPDWSYGELYAKCTELTSRVQANNAALTRLEGDCAAKEAQCQALVRRMRRLERGDASALVAERRERVIAALQARFAAVQGPYEDLKKELMDELQQKDEALALRKTRARDLRVEHEAVYKDMEQDRKDSKAAIQKKERETQNLQLKTKETTGKLTTLQAKLTEQQAAIDAQDAVIDELQAQLKQEEQLQIALQQKRRQQAEALGELTRLCRVKEQTIDELQLKYEALSSDEALLQAARLSHVPT